MQIEQIIGFCLKFVKSSYSAVALKLQVQTQRIKCQFLVWFWLFKRAYSLLMRVFLSCLLFIIAGSFIAYDHFNLSYWMTKPEIRFADKWKYEIRRAASRSKQINKELLLLKDIEIKVTDPNFFELVDKTKKPYSKTAKGIYLLQVQVMPSIDEMNYGFDIQNDIIDTRDNNKVDEFSFSIQIGKLW